MAPCRFLLVIFVFFMDIAVNATVYVPRKSQLESFAEIPPCAISCLSQNIPSIGCALLDIECQCSSQNSTKIMQPCLAANCTFEQTFKLLSVQADLCDRPRDSKSYQIEIISYATVLVAVVVTALRFLSRYIGGSKFWWDDWLQLASAVLVVAMVVATLLNVKAGLGRHIWDLTYDNLINISKYTYITTITWALEILLLKFSILCLYIRIFPNLWLRRAAMGFGVFTVLFTVPLLGMAIFQCVPVDAIWDLEKNKTARCIDYLAILRATVVYEVVAEALLFALPVPIVLRLKLKRVKKIQLIIFFGLGIVIVGISCARIPGLPGAANSDDQPYTITHAMVLGFVASLVGHVCAAVPTIRGLIRLVCCTPNKENGSRPSRFGGGSANVPKGKSQENSQQSGPKNSARHQIYRFGDDKEEMDYLPSDWKQHPFSNDRPDDNHYTDGPFGLEAIELKEVMRPARSYNDSMGGVRSNAIHAPRRNKWVLLDNSRDIASHSTPSPV